MTTTTTTLSKNHPRANVAVTVVSLLLCGGPLSPMAGVIALNEEIPFPGFRYVPWSDLSTDRQVLATSAGWNETTWNLPGFGGGGINGTTPTLEDLSFDSLGTQKVALIALGFTEDQYDCYINHYAYYDWSELQEFDIAPYFETLGWTSESWEGSVPPPASEDTFWNALTSAEQEAAYGICYFEGTWNEETLDDMNVPIVKPEIRFQIWSALSTEEQAFAMAVGWNEDSWNEFTASHEELSFESLSTTQQQALTSMGFYESQYDCYVNHYADYEWSELVQFNFSSYFETLGWSQASWDGTIAAPASEDKDWSELSAGEQEAAGNVCYEEATWNEIPLTANSASAAIYRGVFVWFALIGATTTAKLLLG